MTREIIFLSPQKAEELLKSNHPRNRSLSKSTVLRYADDIENGRWNEDVSEIDSPLILDEYGRLIQGQHRCHAVIKARKGIRCCIVRGASESIYEYLDNGRPRSVATVINKSNADRLSAIASAVYAIEDGTLSLKSAVLGKSGGGDHTYMAPKAAAIEKYRSREELIDRVFALSVPINQKTHLPHTAISVALYILTYVGEPSDKIQSFSADFTRSSLSQANQRLIDYCFKLKASSKTHKRPDDVAFVLHAYDYFKTGGIIKSFNKYENTFNKYEKLVIEKRSTTKKPETM